MYSYPLVRYTDMDEGMRKDVMDVCTMACERHTANNELVRKALFPPPPTACTCREGGGGVFCNRGFDLNKIH